MTGETITQLVVAGIGDLALWVLSGMRGDIRDLAKAVGHLQAEIGKLGAKLDGHEGRIRDLECPEA